MRIRRGNPIPIDDSLHRHQRGSDEYGREEQGNTQLDDHRRLGSMLLGGAQHGAYVTAGSFVPFAYALQVLSDLVDSPPQWRAQGGGNAPQAGSGVVAMRSE